MAALAVAGCVPKEGSKALLVEAKKHPLKMRKEIPFVKRRRSPSMTEFGSGSV